MSVHKYVKLHLIRAKGGKILVCTITEGYERNSPSIRDLLEQIPDHMVP